MNIFISRKYSIYISIFLAIICMGLAIRVVKATGFQPIYQGGLSVNSVFWSSDSNDLTFSDGLSSEVNITDASDWYKYDIQSKTLATSKTWPLQPILSDLERSLFKPATDANRSSFVYRSPDKRYLVYAAPIPDLNQNGNALSVIVGDRQAKQIAVTSAAVYLPFDGPDLFNVLWNKTGISFIVTVLPLSEGAGTDTPVVESLVNNFSDGLSKLQTYPVNIQIDGQTWAANVAYSISDNGLSALIGIQRHTSVVDPYFTETKLVLWNAVTSSPTPLTLFDNQKIIGASFAPDDTSKVLLINDVGLLRYDLVTGHVDTLNTEINSTWARYAIFSPDGKWLTALHSENGDLVYVFNIANDLQSAPISAMSLRMR